MVGSENLVQVVRATHLHQVVRLDFFTPDEHGDLNWVLDHVFQHSFDLGAFR